MPRQPNPAVALRWEQLIQEHQTSNLTVAAFCQRHDVSVPSFYSWRRKIRSQNQSQTKPGKFLPLKIKPPQSTLATIEFPCGARIQIPANETDTLVLLVNQLAANKGDQS